MGGRKVAKSKSVWGTEGRLVTTPTGARKRRWRMNKYCTTISCNHDLWGVYIEQQVDLCQRKELKRTCELHGVARLSRDLFSVINCCGECTW
ncbi:hypothetical protein ACOSQ3_005906 [Xanthoceras sorbifolium]